MTQCKRLLVAAGNSKLFWSVLIVLGLLAKASLFPVATGDYVHFLAPWVAFIRAHGYMRALAFDFFNYAPAYMYWLVLVAKLPIDALWGIKILSVACEYALAWRIGQIASLYRASSLTPWIAFAVVPLLPSVMLNSSYLSQCDALYAFCAISALWHVLGKNRAAAMLWLGLGFAFKLQTIFLLPFFWIYWLRHHLSLRYALLIPLPYILSILPAWAMGHPWGNLALAYLRQADYYQYLTLNFPNPYLWIDNRFYHPVREIGVVLVAMLALGAGAWARRWRGQWTMELSLGLAWLSALLVPFLLPGMHERYLYLGDVLGVAYYLAFRRKAYMPVAIALISFYSYVRCSRYHDLLPLAPAFILYLAVLLALAWDIRQVMKTGASRYD